MAGTTKKETTVEVLSFNKRVSRVKKEVFEALKDNKELDSIKGTNETGFYSIKTIEKHLFRLLEIYDLDLDLEIHREKITGLWIDCIEGSEKIRTIDIDFSRISEVGKLQLMANEVQSEGAVKSYTRRYALTAILNLPSTDIIDSDTIINGNKNGNGGNGGNSGNTNYKVTEKQMNRYFALVKSAGKDINSTNDYVMKNNNLKNINDMNKKVYDAICTWLEKKAEEKKAEEKKETEKK